MAIKIIAKSDTPIYKQIIEQIRYRILTGAYPPGHKIDSVRSLAVKLKVNPLTVQRAYQELKNEDLIYQRRGEGMFVQEAQEGPMDTVKMDRLVQEFRRIVEEARAFGVDLRQFKEQINRELESVEDKGEES